jgi:hypothetical protein
MGPLITSLGDLVDHRTDRGRVYDVLIILYIIGDDRLNRLRSHELQLDFKNRNKVTTHI